MIGVSPRAMYGLRDGRDRLSRLARLLLVGVVLLAGLGAGAPGASAAPPAAGRLSHGLALSPPIGPAASTDLTHRLGGHAPASHVQLTVLRFLLSTARGRAELGHALGAHNLSLLEQTYGTAPPAQSSLRTHTLTDTSTRRPGVNRGQAVAAAASPPTITTLSPKYGPSTGGAQVTITGTNFTGATSVTFGGTPATSFSVISDTVITATSPATTGVGTVDVQVTTPAGSSRTGLDPDMFTYVESPTATPTPSSTATSSATPSSTATATATGTPTQTATATATPSNTATGTATQAATTTPRNTATATSRPPNTATATATPPNTATATSTLRPTSTATATATATPLPTSTTAPPAPSTTTIPATTPCAGYHAVVGGWTLDSAACPSNGHVANVTLSPPSGLTLAGPTPTLASLAVDGANQPVRPIALPDLGIVLAGYTLATGGDTLADNRLTVGTATLHLAPAFGGASLTANGFIIDPGGAAPASVPLASGASVIPVQGFAAQVGGLTLTRDGVVAGAFLLNVPASVMVPGAPILPATSGVTLRADGSLGGTPHFAPPPLYLAGFGVTPLDIVLSNGALVVPAATLGLPPGLPVPPTRTPPTNAPLTGALSIAPDGTIGGVLTFAGGFIPLTLGGFAAAAQILVLDGGGLRALGVTLFTPPNLGTARGFGAQVSIDSVAFSTYYGIANPIDLGPVYVVYDRFLVAADHAQLGDGGLGVAVGRLQLPKVLGVSLTAVEIDGLQVQSDGSVSGGTIPPTATVVGLHVAGATVGIGGLTLSPGALMATKVNLTLPAKLGGSSASFNLPSRLAGLALRPDGTLEGDLMQQGVPIKASIADMKLTALGLGFHGGAFTIEKARLELPIFEGAVELEGISYDGNTLSVVGGGGGIKLPTINAGGFVIEASADVKFADDNGKLSYDFIGDGSINLEKFGGLHVLVEIGSVGPDHPSSLRRAELDVQIPGIGIPIYDTPLVVTSISGGVDIFGDVGHPRYTVHLGLTIETDDHFLFKGTGMGAFSSDGNFGLGVSGTLLDFITIAGGVCVRTIAPAYTDAAGNQQPANDHVCESAMTFTPPNFGGPNTVQASNLQPQTFGQQIDASTSTGFYAAASLTAGFTPRKDKFVGIQGFGYIHVWVDGDGPELAATAAIEGQVPQDAFGGWWIFGLPPCDLQAGADAQLGKFIKDNGSKVIGLKAELYARVCGISFKVGIFVDKDGHVKLGGVNGYQLYDTINNTAYLITTLPNGQRTIGRVKALAAPLHTRQTVFPVRVLPGQTTTLIGMEWRRGAPTLTLTAPDGTTYTPARSGAGNSVFQASSAGQPRGSAPLGAGYVGGVALALPRPQPGLWHVTIGNLHGGEGYRFAAYGAPPTPTLAVTAPAAHQTLVAAPRATLAGTLRGASGAGALSLYYTTAPTIQFGRTTMPNYTGQLISGSVPVHNGRWRYSWDTGALPAGTYYVYATLNNGTGSPVNGYGRGVVRVAQPLHPAPPRAVMATEGHGQLTVMWAPPAHAGIIAGYKLHYRTSGMPAGTEYVLDLGPAQSFAINETERGVRYTASVSDYDLTRRESRPVSAAPVAPAGTAAAPDFSIAAGRASTVTGGYVTAPLTLRPRGRSTHNPADVVVLSVQAPAGVLALPSLPQVNLFAQPTGLAAPVLNVQVPRALRPGTYTLIVTARQQGGRARTAQARLTVRGGVPDFVTMRAGRATRRPDGLLSVPVTVRVVDASGAPVRAGAPVSLSATTGALQPATLRIRGGLARATLVYVPGTRPVVTADADTAAGSLYVGPRPAGASTERFFAAGAAAQGSAGRPALSEDVVLRNLLDVPAVVRLHLYNSGGPEGVVDPQVVSASVLPHGTVTERLGALLAGRPLIGVDVQSDIPLVSSRVVRQPGTRGKARTIGATSGVDAPRTGYRLTLHAGHTMLDLFNPGAGMARVRIAVSGAAKGAPSTGALTLGAGASARVELGSLIAVRRGALTVTLVADRPLVAEVDPAPSSPSASGSTPCIAISGLLATCPTRRAT